ncbi:hypothetical protein IKM_05232 [Bacillus mycoides]|nr:hypothetical protein IKM_05232 [Bacillus mycoides]
MNFVQPIRDPEQIQQIKEYLRENNERNYILFVMGITQKRAPYQKEDCMFRHKITGSLYLKKPVIYFTAFFMNFCPVMVLNYLNVFFALA